MPNAGPLHRLLAVSAVAASLSTCATPNTERRDDPPAVVVGVDAGSPVTPVADAGDPALDAGTRDAGAFADGGPAGLSLDAGALDASAVADAGATDAGAADAGRADAGAGKKAPKKGK